MSERAREREKERRPRRETKLCVCVREREFACLWLVWCRRVDESMNVSMSRVRASYPKPQLETITAVSVYDRCVVKQFNPERRPSHSQSRQAISTQGKGVPYSPESIQPARPSPPSRGHRYPFLGFYFAMCAFPETLKPLYPERLVQWRAAVEEDRPVPMFLGSFLAWVGICIFQGWWSCALVRSYGRPAVPAPREKKFL